MWWQAVDHTTRDEIARPRPTSRHIRCGSVSPQGVDPFLDYNKGVRADLCLQCPDIVSIDRGAILYAARLRVNLRLIASNSERTGFAVPGSCDDRKT